MSRLQASSHLGTHDVANQPVFRTARDYWADDIPLREASTAAGARVEDLARAAKRLGSEPLQSAAQDARRDLPRLKLFDRGGRRLDEVEFHPGYHQVMQAGLEEGYAAAAWDGQPGGHATHAALVYMQMQLEPGAGCPMTMTYAAVPALRNDQALFDQWAPKLSSGIYDPSTRPIWEKQGATLGMAMTEKQGGSDVRANTTRAVGDGEAYRLTGHKWFCSAPMCDGFLTLAQAERGLTCFLVPRWLEGERNAIRLQRLKDKLGNQANASSEIEYHNALAYRLGDEGAGVRTIIEMVHHTRLDTAIAPAALMRAALSEANHWVSHRSAFQRRLIDQPLMRTVLADLSLDCEGALAVSMYLARAFDRDDDGSRALARIGVALAKFLSNKRSIGVVGEAMEVLGGMGYVEETPMPMLYREAPLNSIWEGSGNVICLDILRTLAREPLAVEQLDMVLDAARGHDTRFDAALQDHRNQWSSMPPESEARWFAESLATLLTAATLMETSPQAIVDGYVTSRVANARGSIAGSVRGLDTDAILARLA
ncbi:acyl-CoA dehydrogenase family protein [Shimia thalassica]|uniref:acyl-CoA dehydrogenase family protein n=1 Tax=Shimia thalassica TaxID=1715693 RepID=UPI001C097199|nr:acyl-CoA dehydrogenase family protein [Shimia thalassica]MBU2941489.1 acyl-CoA dehydrogenase family protein [Shimia thalassica]MDO6504130.1 acyl-CoA dehydrogenase family protein [Shimia thalassica]